MAKPGPKKGEGGRPRNPVDPEEVAKLAAIHCTLAEIAAWFGVSHDTIERNFASIIKENREKGRASLRRMQYVAAQGGNVTMLIWLGKQLLGQRDKIEEHVFDGDDQLTDDQLRDKIEAMLDKRKAK